MQRRIDSLRGKIERHKNQMAGVKPTPNGATSRGGGYSRGSRGGGYRVGKPPFRNRTVVFNNGQQTNQSDLESGATSDASTTSWVTRSDPGQLQLINANIYGRNTQSKSRALEQTRNDLQQKNRQEKKMLASHLRKMAASAPPGTANDTSSGRHEIVVEGIRFYVTKNGSKLAKVPDDPAPPSATPKIAYIGDVKFYRSKGGNLYRQGIVNAQRHYGGARKLNELCKNFSSTGSCYLGPQCHYVHNAEKVAACKEFLFKGDCSKGDHCDLSHDLTPQRTPHCLHFAKGNCANPDCRYTHSDAAQATQVCRSFGFYGYCEAGAECTSRHVYGECPNFSNTGSCNIKDCKLQHRERASVMRNARDRTGLVVDASSDEEGNLDGDDDVDSDQVEEWIGQDDEPFLDFEQQKDYIEFV